MQRIATIPADPAAPMFHQFRSAAGEHLLVIPYSRVFDLAPDLARAFDQDSPDRDVLIDALAAPEPGEALLERRHHSFAAEHFAQCQFKLQSGVLLLLRGARQLQRRAGSSDGLGYRTRRDRRSHSAGGSDRTDHRRFSGR